MYLGTVSCHCWLIQNVPRIIAVQNTVLIYFHVGFCGAHERTRGGRQQLWHPQQHTLVGKNTRGQSRVLNSCCSPRFPRFFLSWFSFGLTVYSLNNNGRAEKALGVFLAPCTETPSAVCLAFLQIKLAHSGVSLRVGICSVLCWSLHVRLTMSLFTFQKQCLWICGLKT